MTVLEQIKQLCKLALEAPEHEKSEQLRKCVDECAALIFRNVNISKLRTEPDATQIRKLVENILSAKNLNNVKYIVECFFQECSPLTISADLMLEDLKSLLIDQDSERALIQYHQAPLLIAGLLSTFSSIACSVFDLDEDSSDLFKGTTLDEACSLNHQLHSAHSIEEMRNILNAIPGLHFTERHVPHSNPDCFSFDTQRVPNKEKINRNFASSLSKCHTGPLTPQKVATIS